MIIGKESAKYSLKNLSHRKARSFLTILSIFIGIATVFIFISFGLGLYNYVNETMAGSSADKAIVQGRAFSTPGLDDTFRLEEKDLRAIERTRGVWEASGVYFKIASVEFNDEIVYTFAMGYDLKKPIIMDVFNVEIEEGRELTSSDKNKVVLGYNYMIKDKIFSKPVKLNDKIMINGKEMRVVGFFEEIGSPPDDAQIYMINEAIEEVYSEENNSYGWIVARIDAENIERTIEDMEKSLRDARGQEKGEEDFFVQSFNDMIESYMTIINIIVGFILLIAFISVLVSAVNTANTMITSVLERTREIGTIKAIGAKNSEVFGIFLFESSFLGFIAGVIGVLLGWGLSALGGAILDNLGWGFLAPAFPIWLFVGCILFATISGAVSGVAPALRASRINVVDALRYE
ncbi:MAG: FtsX-like permease family protein [Candidatus Pacearchaeota archaeon]